MHQMFSLAGAVLAFLAVGLGAFGAHFLSGRLSPESIATFETGVRYQMYHALGLFAVAWASTRWPGALTETSGWFMVAGTVLFSGSLYALLFTGHRWMGAITPVGGVALLIAWALLAVRIFKGA